MSRRVYAFIVIFAMLLVGCLDAAAQVSGTKWAVVIGVSDYTKFNANGEKNLKYAHNDAQEIKKRLIEGGMTEGSLVLLVNQGATKTRIQSAFEDTMKPKVKKNDTLFIFFSGHGSQADDDEKNEEEDKKDEFILPFDAEEGKPGTWIRDDEFNKWIMDINARLIVIAFDCCYAAGQDKDAKAIDSESRDAKAIDSESKEIKNGFYNDIGKGIDKKQEILVLAACGDNERAIEMPNKEDKIELQHGLFTYHLLDKFKASRNTTISDDELFEEVKQRVYNVKHNQNPVLTKKLINKDTNEEFPISEFFPCPRIKITTRGLYKPLGGKKILTSVKGIVTGADPDLLGIDPGLLEKKPELKSQQIYFVVLYTFTTSWHVQPYLGSEFTKIEKDGNWVVEESHTGSRYTALLVKPSFEPKNDISKLRTVDMIDVIATTGEVEGYREGENPNLDR